MVCLSCIVRCSGLPDDVGCDLVAAKFKKFQIQGLLIVGGFEVSSFDASDT